MKKITIFLITILTLFLTLNSKANAAVEVYDGDLYIRYSDPTPRVPHPDDPNQPANESGPAWYELNIIPGDSFERTVYVENRGNQLYELRIKAEKVENINNLSDALNINVNGGAVVYNDTLTNLYNEGEFAIDVLPAGQGKTYTMIITFDQNAGNEYMNSKVVFDYLIGISGDVLGETTDSGQDLGDILGATGTVIIGSVIVGILLLTLIISKLIHSKIKKKSNLPINSK